MKIMKLEPSQRKQGRWLVWLEDGCLLRVGEGDVVSLGLYTGKELTQAEGEALAAAQQITRLREQGVSLLSARPMSRKELVEKLSAPARRRKMPENAADGADPDREGQEAGREALRQGAEAVADWLEELGLLNDREYACAVVRHYGGKGYGPRKLRDELYRRGVPRAYWQEALEQCLDGGDALDKLVERRLKGQAPTRENWKKTSDYLARRGFDWEEISAALERYRREE